MGKTAFVFPGQGSQAVGMGRELATQFPAARAIFEQADDALGFSITQLIFDGPDSDLRLTANTQPAILTVSVAAFEVLKTHGVAPDMVAGHSLGEYSALVAAGVLSFTDAVQVVRQRGQFMQEAVPVGKGAMAAVMGADRNMVVKQCEQAANFGIVQAVNFNCPGQIVIAGETAAVEKALELLKAAGAKRVVMLPVSAPFHSSLMKPAGDRLAAVLEKVSFHQALVPIVANVNAKPLSEGKEIKTSLIAQASSPVLWEDCMATMTDMGADVFVEIGPGKVLSGFTKKINRQAVALNLEDSASLEKTLDYFKEVR